MTELTVATINLRHSADRWPERRRLLVAQLVDATPDLISLQEVSFPIGQGRWLRNQVNMRLSGSTNRPYRLVQKRKRHLLHGYFEGIGVLSKLPILHHDVIPLGYGGRLAVRANVELKSGHMVDFVAVHLHHVAHDREAREEQVMKICGWLDEHHHIPHQIIAGDFNETPAGPAIKAMKRVYRSVYEVVNGHEPLATFPTALVERPDGWAGCLDYIFISSAIEQVLSAELFCDEADVQDPNLYASDHVGLLATLNIA
jgi:endonuclease/exonuclease/phosphatase family metal-dependent hydrolase